MSVARPADTAEVSEAVAQAASSGVALEIVAGGSKRAFGRATRTPRRLDISRLAGIVDYDPPELVLTARAATPMAEIEALLEERRQVLAFEPPDWRGLLGGEDALAGAPTLGGTIACNMAGPRRVRAGAARDHLLGFSAVNGRGEAWKAGGRVVKNVTGYDLCKLQAGAFGTLSVLTELSVRVAPRPESSCSVLLRGLSDADGLAALSRALGTPHEVSAAAHLPEAAARRSAVLGGDGSATALRLEGHAPSVAFRADALRAMFGRGERLEAADSARLWQEIGGVHALLDTVGRYVWRVCTTPSSAVACASAVMSAQPAAEMFYDWGGGLLWLSLPPDAPGDAPDGGAATVRAAMRDGGHATLVRADAAVRATTQVFEPEPPSLAALTARVKAGFDPLGILNPGRLWAGI